MLWKIARKSIGRRKLAYCMIFLLLSMITLAVLLLASATDIKLKKYASISGYFKQNGIMIKSEYLQTEQNGIHLLIRDEKEMMAQFPVIREMLTVTELWETWIVGRNRNISVWCYNENVTELLEPAMASGRWFEKSDYESDVLKAVVTYNEGELSPGDVVTLKTAVGDARQEVQIIGVMENDESLFYSTTDHQDYRDCFYTYDYKSENGRVILLLSDAQILGGEESGRFEMLNFRLNSELGFQRQMRGETIVIFQDDATEEEIASFKETLKQNSRINRIYSLSVLNRNSRRYIYEDLNKYFPIIFCFFVFVLIAVCSAHIVSAKKNLDNYAIFYMCGLSWNRCCAISFYVSVLLSAASFVFFCVLYALLLGLGRMKPLPVDAMPLYLVCILAIDAVFIAVSWAVPYLITKRTSAAEIMKQL